MCSNNSLAWILDFRVLEHLALQTKNMIIARIKAQKLNKASRLNNWPLRTRKGTVCYDIDLQLKIFFLLI